MNALELIRADNPFLEPLGSYINRSDLPARLAVDPLAGIDRGALTEWERRLLLKQIRRVFEPSVSAIQVVSTVQDMMWNSCVMKNPLLQENRLRYHQLLGLRGKTLSELPWMPRFADGLMVMGCTGIGKSTTVMRYLSLIVQVHVHSENEAAGWVRRVQITYLVVSMSVYRTGLLQDIAAEIDRLAGTSYRSQYSDSRRWPIEKLAVEIGLLLVQHGVAVLVIEEVQARNFGLSANREEMLLFILRLLNFGIAVVMVGNPLGFVGIEAFSQDLNRLTETEPVHLMPPAADSPEWMQGFGEGLWNHNVMPEYTPWTPEIANALHACSAGFPDYARKAVEGAQLRALNRGSRSVNLCDLEDFAKTSLTVDLNRDFIEGFAQRDHKKLMGYLDVPWEAYGLQWGSLTLEELANSNPPTVDGRVVDSNLGDEERKSLESVHEKLRRAAKAKATRAEKAKATQGASSSEFRQPGGEALAKGLSELRASAGK